MDLVFIHGRAQQGRSSGELRDQWLPGLRASFQTAGIPFPDFDNIHIPFYGDKLDELTAARPATTASITRRSLRDDEQFDPFVADFVLQMARRAGMGDEEIQQALDEENVTVVERGPLEWGWVQGLASFLDRRTPWLTNQVLDRVVADVKAYVNRPDVRRAIHEIIRPMIGNKPAIVISHSLGTVVAYWLLAKEPVASQNVPLFFTVGSPLGLRAIKDKIPNPRNFPAGVNHWINMTDKRDIVALTERLNGPQNFLPGIEDWDDISNGDEPHAIERYLQDPRVARNISAIMNQ